MHQDPGSGSPESPPKPPVAHWRPGPAAVFALVAAAMVIWWLALALRYPYFYLADMDLLAPLEALNVNSGYEASVPLHPGYGMYLVDAITLRIAHAAGLMSIRDIPSLQSSLSPLLTMAEITGFFRLHSPLLVFGIALALWAAASRLGRYPAWFSILTFFAIATMEGLAYQATVIRVELYSAFFWSLALPIAAMAAIQRRASAEAALLTLSGALLGLAFLTKIQSGVHLAGAGLMFWTARELIGRGETSASQSPVSKRIPLALAVLNLVILTALLIKSRYTVTQHFTLVGYLENPINFAGAPIGRAAAVIAGCAGLAILQIIPAGNSKWGGLAADTARIFTWVVTGGVLAILSPLTLYRDLSTGLSYAIHNLQNLFWTNQFSFRSSESTDFILAAVFNYHWWVIAAAAAAWIVAFGAVTFFASQRRGPRLALIAAWAAFAATILVASIRTTPRDMLWLDTGFGLTSLALIAIALHATPRAGRAAGGAVLAFLAAGNVTRLVEFPSRMDTTYHIYGWTESPWMDCWFATPQYNKIMADRYTTEISKTQAARQARNHWRLRIMLGHIFQNADINLANAGPVAVGEPVWRSHPEWRLSEIPRGFNLGTHIVDPLGTQLSRHGFLTHVTKHEEWLDRKAPPPPAAGGQTPDDPVHALSLLPRRDIEVLIFAPEADITRLSAADESIQRRGAGEEALAISVSNGAQSQRLVAATIQNYTVLPLQNFTGPFFFVIRERNLPPPFGYGLYPSGGPKENPAAAAEPKTDGGAAGDAAP